MRKLLSLGMLIVLGMLVAACAAVSSAAAPAQAPLHIGAIPDQDPELLQRLYGKLATYLTGELGVPVEYKPVTDYTAAVTAFKIDDLDLVWFGGLTGVQARLQVDGAEAIVQRDIDAQFRSVFIANHNSHIAPFEEGAGLQALKGHTFTFGSQSSTSGRLMPQYYLQEAGVQLEDFRGEAGFSGSHDKTIQLVEAGSYEAGVLNSQVWESRVAEGKVDLDKVQVVWTTPPYYDYHWLLHPDAVKRYGNDFADKVKTAFTKLDPSVAKQREILDLFGAHKFIETQNSNYDQIESIGRQIGMVSN